MNIIIYEIFSKIIITKKTKSKTKKITKNFIILPKALIFSNQNGKNKY